MRLSVVSGREVVRALEKIGFVRQRGSHIRLRDDSSPNHPPLSVPDHRTVKRGLLRDIIRDAGLTVEEFVELLSD